MFQEVYACFVLGTRYWYGYIHLSIHSWVHFSQQSDLTAIKNSKVYSVNMFGLNNKNYSYVHNLPMIIQCLATYDLGWIHFTQPWLKKCLETQSVHENSFTHRFCDIPQDDASKNGRAPAKYHDVIRLDSRSRVDKWEARCYTACRLNNRLNASAMLI